MEYIDNDVDALFISQGGGCWKTDASLKKYI